MLCSYSQDKTSSSFKNNCFLCLSNFFFFFGVHVFKRGALRAGDARAELFYEIIVILVKQT